MMKRVQEEIKKVCKDRAVVVNSAGKSRVTLFLVRKLRRDPKSSGVKTTSLIAIYLGTAHDFFRTE